MVAKQHPKRSVRKVLNGPSRRQPRVASTLVERAIRTLGRSGGGADSAQSVDITADGKEQAQALLDALFGAERRPQQWDINGWAESTVGWVSHGLRLVTARAECGPSSSKHEELQPASKRHGSCFGDRAALLSVRYFFLAPRRAIAAFMSSIEARLEGRPNMPLRFLISASPLRASRS